MVRVISVHHFASQHIQLVEQPTASAIASPNRLLLALSSHCIEVRDLKDSGDVLFSFPTVDEVTQMKYCLNGDYIATVETKYNRQNREINFVRIYINWDGVATLQQSKMTSSGVSLGSSECGMVQPMRARIAGRVTPTTNHSELGSLEMIEIPLRNNPTSMDCCQVSGNILILCGKQLVVYTFQVKTHDISKLKFIDFEEMPLTIELSFRPMSVSICENYIACMSSNSMLMFKICQVSNKQQSAEGDVVAEEFSFRYSKQDETIDYKQLLKQESLKSKSEHKITVNLPTIVKENSLINKYSPFTFTDKDMSACIRHLEGESSSNKYEIHYLIQLKLTHILVDNAQRQVTEEFKTMILKPLYTDPNICKASSESRTGAFRSKHSHLLHSVACMIATQQEGYLYQFCDYEDAEDVENCITVYPFTAPVFQLVMEDHLLHALTETGLESYTLRTGHQLCRKLETIDDVNVACPPVSDSVCLVGLRPFLGVEKILLSSNNLVLLANADNSPTHSIGSNSSCSSSIWTMYNLSLPTPKTMFSDISVVANQHRFSSAQTYCHLMSEAHMILRTTVVLAKWATTTEGSVNLITPKKDSTDEVVEAYLTSCALLGDHFILSAHDSDYKLGLPYYKMAGIQPHEVLKRVKRVQMQSNNFNSKGLLHYLKHTLLELRTSGDADKLFGASSKQNFIDAILELFELRGYDDLPKLVLKSPILREYSTDKFISVLNKKVSNDSLDICEKVLATSLLYIQKCKSEQAVELLQDLDKEDLYKLLCENWELLFDYPTGTGHKSKNLAFSELCVMLFSVCPNILGKLFIHLIMEARVVTLNKVLKAFLDYLPSNIGTGCNSASIVLQDTLERYFKSFFLKYDSMDVAKVTYDRATYEAMKILVRSYLSQIQMLQLKEITNSGKADEEKEQASPEKRKTDEEATNDDKDEDQEKSQMNRSITIDRNSKNQNYLLSKFRYSYLDKMPPFQIEITSKLYEVCLENYKPREQLKPNEEADLVLKKLQALLCSQAVPKQVTAEVKTFLEINENFRGNHSLQSISMTVSEAVVFLLDICPQCLLEYAKDRFTKADEWKFLIATLQQRILTLSQNEKLHRVCFFHKKLLKDILTHVATSMRLEQLVQVFPQRLNTTSLQSLSSSDNLWCLKQASSDKVTPEENLSNDSTDLLNEIQNYEPFLVICKETMHANQIRKLITTTAQQLLCTLNFDNAPR